MMTLVVIERQNQLSVGLIAYSIFEGIVDITVKIITDTIRIIQCPLQGRLERLTFQRGN